MDNTMEFEAAFCRASEGFTPDDPGVICEFDPPVERYITKGNDPFCYAIRQVAPIESHRAIELLDAEIARAAHRGYTSMQWRTFGFPSPPHRADMESALLLRGFTLKESEQLLWTPTDPRFHGLELGPSGPITIRPVTSNADFDHFIAVNERAFGKPETWFDAQLRKRVLAGDLASKAILAEFDNTPVGSSWLKVFRSFAFLCGGAVVPEHRGKGAYRAMVQHRIAMAHQLEIPFALAECVATSERVLRRMGFRDAGVIRRWWRVPVDQK